MALNQDKVGTAYPAYTYEVAREKIREYAAAVGETEPRYYSDGDDCVAPPTFAACFTVIRGGQAAADDPEVGTHTSMVHGSQRFAFGDRPLRPGDVLSCTPRIASISARGDNEFMVTEVECLFAGSGDLAVRSEAMMVFLGSAPDATPDTARDASGGASTGTETPGSSSASPEGPA